MEFAQFGKYLMLHKIAVGGMAEIFLAKQAGLAGFEKLVVIKRILPEHVADPDFVRMFLDEARLAASMTHPNVPQVFDLDRVGNSIYIAMEYISGQDFSHLLRACLKARTRLPFPLVARILAGACEGLHYAHTLKDSQGAPLGLVHRDVTPSNIVVSYEGLVKILDFGVAKTEAQVSKTAAGKLKGKFPYMAPEQIRMETLDARVDVWALGVVLWEALARKRLFGGANELGIIKKIMEIPVLPPSAMEPEVPMELEVIAMKALQRDKNRRYASAQAMQKDLEAWLATLPAPTTGLEVSAFVKTLFAAEYATHQKLLSEVPHATPEQLADLVRLAEPDSYSTGGELSHSGASEAKQHPRLRHRKGVVALAVGGVALAALGWALLRPAPVTSGEVAVSSDPSGAAVFLDGQARPEKTPATLAAVPLGRHELRLELAGRQVRSAEVELTAQRPQAAVLLTLSEVAAEPGILTVATEPPGANVYLDGTRQGPSPVTLPKVAASVEHTLLAEKDGYEMASQTLTLAPGSKREVVVALKPKEAPAVAVVSGHGKKVGPRTGGKDVGVSADAQPAAGAGGKAVAARLRRVKNAWEAQKAAASPNDVRLFDPILSGIEKLLASGRPEALAEAKGSLDDFVKTALRGQEP